MLAKILAAVSQVDFCVRVIVVEVGKPATHIYIKDRCVIILLLKKVIKTKQKLAAQ